MGIVTSMAWAARMDAAVKSQDEQAVIKLVDQLIAREEYEDRGARRVGRWWHALFGGKLDVNDLEDHQLTKAQLRQRNAVRQQKRQQLLDSFLDDIEYVPDGR